MLLVVTPDSVFGMLVSAQAVVVTLFGGVASVWGPVIGAAILIPLAETLQAELGTYLPGIQGVVYGVAIIAVMLLSPDGLFWTIRDRWFRGEATQGLPDSDPTRSPCRRCATAPPPTRRRPLLHVESLSAPSAVSRRSARSASRWRRARSSASSGRTARARPRCSTC